MDGAQSLAFRRRTGIRDTVQLYRLFMITSSQDTIRVYEYTRYRYRKRERMMMACPHGDMDRVSCHVKSCHVVGKYDACVMTKMLSIYYGYIFEFKSYFYYSFLILAG